jgi:starch synthase (maltosyl-transferring)
MLDPKDLRRTVVIEHVAPVVDGGRYPVKREVGDRVEVSADVFKEGHEFLLAFVKYRRADTPDWRESPMRLVDNDRWAGAFTVEDNARYLFTIEALPDPFRSWLADLAKRVAAGQDVASELREGAAQVREAASRATGADAATLGEWLARIEKAPSQAEAVAAVGEAALAALMDRHLDRADATWAEHEYEVVVDRERSRFAAWYEFFPRSGVARRHGTFRDAEAQLERAAAMGFDVVYLPPIHPIGRAHRKGANNALTAQPGEPGSPWAIGGVEGGHDAVHPDLGTLADFDRFVRRARALGLEVALDFAIQASPDHPWVREHPEWFRHRPDGTIKYAENPPKKYQDIYPFDFECEDWRGLWQALLDVTLFWIRRDVRIFRVDNPHTKSFGFWEWMIDQVHARHPDVIFLSEAFTRPAVMRYLAKTGFTQSYTYFTWRNTKAELTDYFIELTTGEAREYLRPNLFANTPDILHAYLQQGGRPAFEARLLLAATLGANYGIYSGFELAEGRAVPGTEEYADSEKYQFRNWDWDRSGNIAELVSRVNQIRHAHRALQFDSTLRFHATDNPEIIAYSKRAPGNGDTIFVVVNLDPLHMQHGHVALPGYGPDATYTVRDLIDDVIYEWRGAWNYVRFDPDIRQGHILWLPTHRT